MKVFDSELLQYIEKTVDIKNPREWYYALMDYGAFLGKGEKENPNIKSVHYKKQSRFKGSERELRGKILRAVLTHKNSTPMSISKKTGIRTESVKRILLVLKMEGFIR